MRRKFAMRVLCFLLALSCFCGCGPKTDSAPPQTTEQVKAPVTVSSFSELKALLAGDSLKPDDTLQITDSMEITEEIQITMPICLSVKAAVSCSAPIVFRIWDAGLIVIDIADGVDTSGLDIRLDAPNCDVQWLTGYSYSSEEEAARLTNVRSFNGVDLRGKFSLGGTAQNSLTGVSLEPENNPSLTEPLHWKIEGNVAYLAVSYLVDDDTLRNAQVFLQTADGAAVTRQLDLTQNPYYTVTDSDGNTRGYQIITYRLTYNLPVFYIQIKDGEEVTSREQYLEATLSVDAETAAGDFPSLKTSPIQIRGRGHYSWNFDKKPYKIRFEKKTSVLGLQASKNWTLIANYTDRSLIQNYVAMEMGKVMEHIPYHANQYPVDVFVNGSYRGVYTFGEQLEAKKERIDLEENYEEPDTDYLLEVGGADDDDVEGRDFFHAGTLKHVAIKHPETQQLQPAQLDYLKDYVNKADQAVQTLTDYEDYIDVDSVIDWVILHELTYNLDCCFRRSCYLIKEKGGKLKMGPIWDFDLAFGSYFRYEAGDWATVGEEGGYVGVTWMNYLRQDPAFMARFTARWHEKKAQLLETALSAVDSMGDLVAPSARMNFAVWKILGQSVPAQPASHKQYDTYEKMLRRLRSFIEERYQWLDGQITL